MRRNIRGLIWFPTAGIVLFVGLYAVAAACYRNIVTGEGFSWWQSYWCDLYDAASGDSYIPAVVGTVVLAVAVAVLWGMLASFFQKQHELAARIIRWCGVGTTLTMPLLFLGNHEVAVHAGSALGGTAVALTLWLLYKTGRYGLLVWGLSCIVLMLTNYAIYTSEVGLSALPFLQKVTFGVVLSWLCGLNGLLARRL